MRTEADGRPKLGASLSTLGVRANHDIPVAADGSVAPGQGGMSVTPDDPDLMPFDLLPRSRGGDGRHPMFAFEVANLPPTLTARQDAPDHANVEPAAVCQFSDYNTELQGTRLGWDQVP